MIEASLTKQLGSFRLQAELSSSGFTCLAGKNGAGKTTLLRAIAGLTSSQGYVRLDGHEVSSLPPERRSVVMVTPASQILHLDVGSHLLWGAKLGGGAAPRDLVDEAKSRLGIAFGGPVRRLSLGMKERVSLATALLSGRRLILVDEAFANLNDRETFISMYRDLAKKAGVEVAFSSLDRSDGLLADHLYVIEDGRTREED